MHGEYKTPGGKLVMADLDVCNRREFLTCIARKGGTEHGHTDSTFAPTAILFGARSATTTETRTDRQICRPFRTIIGKRPKLLPGGSA